LPNLIISLLLVSLFGRGEDPPWLIRLLRQVKFAPQANNSQWNLFVLLATLVGGGCIRSYTVYRAGLSRRAQRHSARTTRHSAMLHAGPRVQQQTPARSHHT